MFRYTPYMETVMRYKPTVNLWNKQNRANLENTLQRGQWVSAGPVDELRTNIGRFCGVTKSGTVVVAWIGNARNGGTNYYREYMKANMHYAKGRMA